MGDRPAKLNEKKSDRARAEDKELIVGRTKWKFFSVGEKMKNPSSHQGDNERVKKREQQQVRDFLHKMCN